MVKEIIVKYDGKLKLLPVFLQPAVNDA